jgi:hypothetical protein
MGLHLLKPYAESKYTMKSYKASDLFSIKIDQLAAYPLNVEFEEKPNLSKDLKGSGLFQLFFDQTLIYIGLAGKEPAILRFEKQLSTITLRGTNVSFNKQSKDYLNNTTLNTVFSSALNQNKDAFESSIKRIAFAVLNWHLFSQFNQSLLERFVFVWFPMNNCLTNSLPEICKEWRRSLKPICNG